MSSAFLKMKKERQKFSQKRMENIKNDATNKNRFKDERFYYPERDKSGNGYAVIRFLGSKDPSSLPYVRVFSHGFKDVGGWLIDNCPTTIDKPCPICEANSKLWNSGVPANKSVASARKRNKQFITNILVVKDTVNPDNEGKVFLYKFGKTILDMITAAGSPQFEDEEPIDAFDLWGGANFKLKIVKKAGQTNYDRSEFDSPSPVADSDEGIEKVWSAQYDLNEFVAPEQFKSYEELQERFARVTGGSAQSSADDVEEEYTAPSRGAGGASNQSDNRASESSSFGGDEENGMADGVDDEEDALSFFENAANQ